MSVEEPARKSFFKKGSSGQVRFTEDEDPIGMGNFGTDPFEVLGYGFPEYPGYRIFLSMGILYGDGDLFGMSERIL